MPPKSKSVSKTNTKMKKIKGKKMAGKKKANRKAIEQKIFNEIEDDLKKNIDRSVIYAALVKDVIKVAKNTKFELPNFGSIAFFGKESNVDGKEQPKMDDVDEYEDIGSVVDDLPKDTSVEQSKIDGEDTKGMETKKDSMNSIGVNPAPDGVVYKTQCFIKDSIKEKMLPKGEIEKSQVCGMKSMKKLPEKDGKELKEGMMKSVKDASGAKDAKNDVTKSMKEISAKSIKEKEISAKGAKESSAKGGKELSTKGIKEVSAKGGKGKVAKEASSKVTKETSTKGGKEASAKGAKETSKISKGDEVTKDAKDKPIAKKMEKAKKVTKVKC